MSRSKARVVAMQAVFQLDDDPSAVRPIAEYCSSEECLQDRDLLYLEQVLDAVAQNQTAIDDFISRYSIDWDISRLGNVERSILRVAIGEMLYIKDVPVSVAINEAVLLAKKFGAEQASKFINGILGKFSREVLGEKRHRGKNGAGTSSNGFAKSFDEVQKELFPDSEPEPEE